MQPDLQGLEISKGEVRHLSGVDPDEVFRPSLLKNPETRLSFLFQELLLGLVLTPILFGFFYTFIILPTLGYSMALVILSLMLSPISVIIGRWYWRKNTTPKLLISLLDEVERYNAVIRAISIHDQLETAGSTVVSLNDREKVIAALQLTREDLVRALSTEKILRDNQEFIATNQQLFLNNLSAVRALQTTDQASEYGRLLNEALQIAMGVQEDMRKLQSRRSRP